MICVRIPILSVMLLAGSLPAAHAQARHATDTVSRAQPQGSYGLRNQQFGLFLRPRDASNKTGEPIVLYPYQPWKCMAWHFDPARDGVRLINYFTDKSFEVDTSTPTRPLLQQSASPDHRPSETVHFIALEGGFFEIEAPGGAGVLTAVDSDGHGDIRVIVAPWKQAPSQRWSLVDLPAHFTM